MKIKKIFFYVSVICSTIACSVPNVVTQLPSEHSSQYSLKENDYRGIVIGSIAIKLEKPIHESYVFFFKNMQSKSSSEKYEEVISIGRKTKLLSDKLIPDKIDGDYAIYHFVLKREPNQYFFHQLRLADNVGTGIGIKDIKLNFPFEVFANEITYIGRLVFEGKESKISLQNNYGQDLEYIKELNRKIDWDKIKINNAIPQ
jgi:hypothetical protein